MLNKIIAYFNLRYKTFDSGVWKSHPEKRKNLIQDVLRQNMAVGKNQEQILMLFGNERRIYSNGSWSYPISFFRDGNPKKFLHLYFNNMNVVTHMRIKFIIKN
ncbi:hypothetical protein AR685_17355 [Chryseobacterium sp. JAH]|nr:hypothetical protein AR685_17355 [Chryseobacterium sp. JAH]